MCISSNEYSEKNYKINFEGYMVKCPSVIAKIKLCGGAMTFEITDEMQFEIPTKEQCENLKKTFGIEVELVDTPYFKNDGNCVLNIPNSKLLR